MDRGHPALAALIKTLNTATGWRGVSDLIGAGQAVANQGLPTGVAIGPDGQLVLKTKSPDAQAYGSDIATVPETTTAAELPEALSHEGRHNLQDQVLGPAMIAAKPLEMLHQYGRGPLEADAFRHEQPRGEITRQGPQGVYSKVVSGYLRGLLGE